MEHENRTNVEEMENCEGNAAQPTQSTISMSGIMENQIQFQMKMMEILASFSSSRSRNDEMQAAHLTFAKFDPDTTVHSVLEWVEEINRIKDEIGMLDTVVVLKAGEALKGRAAKFYQNWKPLVRNWSTFSRDLQIAFPEKGTPATRLESCMSIKSDSFSSFVEYGHAKLNSIKKFYNKFPWEIILSLVSHDIVSIEVKNRVILKEPKDETELLKILSSYDADIPFVPETLPRNSSIKRPVQVKKDAEYKFHGTCRKCGFFGHKAVDCRSAKRRFENSIKICNFCKMKGHSEQYCNAKKRENNTHNQTL